MRETLLEGVPFRLKYLGMTLVEEPKGEEVSAMAVKRITATVSLTLSHSRSVTLHDWAPSCNVSLSCWLYGMRGDDPPPSAMGIGWGGKYNHGIWPVYWGGRSSFSDLQRVCWLCANGGVNVPSVTDWNESMSSLLLSISCVIHG